MKRRTQTLVGTFAVLFAFGIGGEAQQRETPPAPATTTPPAKASDATGQSVTVNLEGCVFPRRALTAKQKITLAADSIEDFVLSDTQVISLAPGTEVTNMSLFKLEQVDRARLNRLNGMRVLVTGRVESTPELRTLRVTSIIETAGHCPVVPTPQP